MSDTIETLCQSCVGACCRQIGTPPGFALFYARKPEDVERCRALSWGDDAAHHDSAPEEARRILADYYASLDAGLVSDRAEDGSPCLWLDEATSRCRFHAHRPEICREFDPGEESCLNWRDTYGIAMPGTKR